MEKYGKTTVFPGGYGRIGEIPHGRLWPDWGLKVMADSRLQPVEKTVNDRQQAFFLSSALL